MNSTRLAAMSVCLALCVTGTCAHANPLFRIHVRHSLLRLPTLRLPSVSLRGAAGLVPQAALVPLVRTAVTQGLHCPRR